MRNSVGGFGAAFKPAAEEIEMSGDDLAARNEDVYELDGHVVGRIYTPEDGFLFGHEGPFRYLGTLGPFDLPVVEAL